MLDSLLHWNHILILLLLLFSRFPVILSIENHCSLPQQKKMAQHFTNILGGEELSLNIAVFCKMKVTFKLCWLEVVTNKGEGEKGNILTVLAILLIHWWILSKYLKAVKQKFCIVFRDLLNILFFFNFKVLLMFGGEG